VQTVVKTLCKTSEDAFVHFVKVAERNDSPRLQGESILQSTGFVLPIASNSTDVLRLGFLYGVVVRIDRRGSGDRGDRPSVVRRADRAD
jgi:hypothetical protein